MKPTKRNFEALAKRENCKVEYCGGEILVDAPENKLFNATGTKQVFVNDFNTSGSEHDNRDGVAPKWVWYERLIHDIEFGFRDWTKEEIAANNGVVC